MQEPSGNTKKTKAPWFLGAFVLFLLTFLILLQSSNMWKSFSVETAGDTLLLYALSSLNFFAFIIFGFILLRNLIKLARERRSLTLGAKIKTRLWLYFFAVSIMPIIAMAVFSFLFMNRALERWFTSIPNNVIAEAKKVQEKAIRLQSDSLVKTAQMLAVTLDKHEFTNDDLKRIADAGNLIHVEVLSKNLKTISVFQRQMPTDRRVEADALLDLVRSGAVADAALADGSGFDAAIASFSDGRRLLIMPDSYTEENVSQMVDKSVAEFERLKERELTIRQFGLSTLGVLTFLLIFASSWTALYIARGLTVPIKALAEGADEIAQGNFGHRVDVFAEDELALLVGSFNEMSAKLEENSAELLERRRYIEIVLESLPTGVISFDHENRVTTINKSAIQILRLEDADFKGIELDRVLAEDNRLVIGRLLNRARRTGRSSEQTTLVRENTNGLADPTASLPVALTATALPRDFGESSGVVLVIEDLSELIAAQRSSAWQEVARRMAHEIKNPLTPIQLSAERIAKRCQVANPGASMTETRSNTGSLDAEQTKKVIRDGTETILREVSSLKAMVDEFSRFARLPNVRLEPGSLNEIVRQAATLYEDRSVKIQLALADNLPQTMLDEEQLRRVFVNLIENSIEAFGTDAEEPRIWARTFFDKAREIVVAEISDNGAGIPPSDFQKLFQPYFSTKGRGTGLGLAIVQRIVSEHRGRIKAVGNQPRGARFIIELPVV